jgi:hypothetical protein
MGEAKARRENAVPMIYHHTSTLRTNLIWMSGVIELEGRSEGAIHPKLGKISTNALSRRSLNDFPAVAWFTSGIDTPKCLLNSAFVATDERTGEMRVIDLGADAVNAIALNRVALGFPIDRIQVVRWPEYYGSQTDEGRELTNSAREMGDNTDEWYISETPIDVMELTEFWYAKSIMKPKLLRSPVQVKNIHEMVMLCRTNKGAFIPPTWMKPELARRVAAEMGLPVKG